MKTADQYIAEIERIIGASLAQGKINLQWEVSSPKEAKLHITKIIQMQKELQLVKREMGNDIKLIRANYKARASNAEAGFWSSFAGRRAADHDRARKKEAIKQEGLSAIMVYENFITQIDKFVVQLDGMKIEIERMGRENT